MFGDAIRIAEMDSTIHLNLDLIVEPLLIAGVTRYHPQDRHSGRPVLVCLHDLL